MHLPFGIPAGPLLNGKFVKAALDKGFDIVVYKTVRTRKYPCAPWPNVLAIRVKDKITLEMADKGVLADTQYQEPLSITNSFGVPSFEPDFWQKDMADTVKYAKEGQIIVGSFQGTTTPDGNIKEYIKDFVLAAKLVKETGAKILEANLSCPNESTSHLLCFDIERTKEIVEAIKNEIGNTPLVIKVAYFQDVVAFRKLVQEVGNIVDGISTINTIPAKIYKDKEHTTQALPGNNRLVSGTCGHAIKWAGLESVKRLKQLHEELRMSYTIFGVGGVTVPEDYFEYKKAGADVVMSATGAMWNPHLAKETKQKALSTYD